MTRIEFYTALGRIAARLDEFLKPKDSYNGTTRRAVGKLEIADSRVRIAVYVAWLALRGDTTFFRRWETQGPRGIEQFSNDLKKERQRARLVAAAERDGTLSLQEEIGGLIIRNRGQAWEIRKMQEASERRNRDLNALHLVWCDGGCPGGAGAAPEIDRQTVQAATRQVRRLVRWWNCNLSRRGLTAEDYERECVSFEDPPVGDQE